MDRKQILALAWLPLLFGPAKEALAGVDYERVISLNSVAVVAVKNSDPVVASVLYGTGAFRYYTDAACTSPGAAVPVPLPPGQSYYARLVVTAGTGLIYSNGENPANTPPLHTFPAENFNQQNDSGTPGCRKVNLTFGTPPNFSLSGLILTSTSGSTLTFNGAGSYTYSGNVFMGHSAGKYKSRNSIPEPGVLALLLSGIGALAFARYRSRRRLSAA